MSNTTYKAGDRVVITGNTWKSNVFKIGDMATVHRSAVIYCTLKSEDGQRYSDFPTFDFRPAEASYSLQEYRDRLPVSDAMNDSDPSDHINF